MPGSVTWKNWLSFPAPSIADASYKDSGIFWIAATRIIVEIPNVFQIATNTTTKIAELVLLSKLISENPRSFNQYVKIPIFEWRTSCHVTPTVTADAITGRK